DLLGLPDVGADLDATWREEARDRFERRRLGPEVLDIWNREREVHHVPRAQLGPDEHEARRIGVRQRAEQHGVDDAEDCRAGTDAKRDRDDRDGREAWVLAQSTHTVGDVFEQRVHDSYYSARGPTPARSK